MVFLIGISFALLATPALAGTVVNINSADAVQIASALDGIGQKKAEKIIAWRSQYGAFHRLDELAKVPGIGDKLAQRNASWIRFDVMSKQNASAVSLQEGKQVAPANLVVPVKAYAR